MTNFHICVKIDGEIERIRKGEGTVIEGCSDTQARNLLLKAKEEGKDFRSGCNNMDETGICKGHEK